MTGSLVAALAAVLLLPEVGLVQERQPDRPATTTFQLKNSYADEVGKILAARLGKDGEVQITWDERTNKIFLRGNEETVRRAKRILERFDPPPRTKYYMPIFQLKHAKAVPTAVLMKVFLNLVPYPGGRSRIRVTPDERTNSLIICGLIEEEALLLEAILSRIG
jgi:type II secretory pathway component GspD/PulD (secretin)